MNAVLMKLLTIICLLMLATAATAQDVNSPSYKHDVRNFWHDIRKKDMEMNGAGKLLVVRQSFPYKVNSNKYKYGDPEFFLNYLDRVGQKAPATVYKKEVINGREAGEPSDSLVFTKAEQDALTAYFNSKKTFLWSTDVLGDVSLVNSATIDSFYNKDDNIRKDFIPEYPHDYFQLSAPLFLRNNTICVFYIGHLGNSASHGKINVYIKDEDGWEVFAALESWEE